MAVLIYFFRIPSACSLMSVGTRRNDFSRGQWLDMTHHVTSICSRRSANLTAELPILNQFSELIVKQYCGSEAGRDYSPSANKDLYHRQYSAYFWPTWIIKSMLHLLLYCNLLGVIL